MKNLVKKFIPPFLLRVYHYALSLTGAFVYDSPSKNLIVIGVTGTSGKSTVVDLIHRVLAEAGNKVASLSSVRFKIQEQEEENRLKMTMPGRLRMQKFLRKAVKAGCKYAVVEVTSEGIKQHRHNFIEFDGAVFTNLAAEHIESHGGFENYRNEKLKLFKKAKNIHIINLDDENAEYFLKIPSKEKYLYHLKTKNSHSRQNFNGQEKIIEAEDIKLSPNGANFAVQGVQFGLNLLGEFNIYNALATICVGLSYNVSLEICKRALEKAIGIPGRMEIVLKEPFTVIVDYAHTPAALEQVYKTLKPSPLICVLGSCGGGRDKWKRPVLGKLAADYCKEIIITNEDPYDDDPIEIINQVAEGAKGKAKKILDRREAIKEALRLAQPNDAVIITGKGCEPWMCVAKGKKIPWDDREIVKEEFQKLKNPA